MSSKKVALIGGLGKGSDFGEKLVRHLLDAGYTVAGLARNPDPSSLPESVHTFPCDLTHHAAVRARVNHIEAEIGPIAVYVHNASGLVRGAFSESIPADFELAWRGTLLTAVTVCNVLTPYMIGRSQGTVIFTGATASVRGGSAFAAFSSAKFALRGLSQSMARELGPKGIHVAHVLVDGLITGPRAQEVFNAPTAKCIDAGDLAQVYMDLIAQNPSCWTQELDLRPSVETF